MSISKRIAMTWTDAARDCYNIGCQCNKCLLSLFLEEPCYMRDTVFELVRKFGAPKNEKESIFTKYQLKIITAIKNGCGTVTEIAEECGKSESAITGMLHTLYMKARKLGWNPKKRGIVTQSLLPQFIKWVRKELDESI